MTGLETGLLIAGTAISALGAVSSAVAQKSASNYNAKVAENNAASARQQAQVEADRQRREATMRMGDMRAAYGASGVSLEGSPLDVLEQSAYLAERDAQTTIWQGETKARGYGSNAILDRMQGSNAATAGGIQAGSAILLGSTKVLAANPQWSK